MTTGGGSWARPGDAGNAFRWNLGKNSKLYQPGSVAPRGEEQFDLPRAWSPSSGHPRYRLDVSPPGKIPDRAAWNYTLETGALTPPGQDVSPGDASRYTQLSPLPEDIGSQGPSIPVGPPQDPAVVIAAGLGQQPQQAVGVGGENFLDYAGRRLGESWQQISQPQEWYDPILGAMGAAGLPFEPFSAATRYGIGALVNAAEGRGISPDEALATYEERVPMPLKFVAELAAPAPPIGKLLKAGKLAKWGESAAGKKLGLVDDYGYGAEAEGMRGGRHSDLDYHDDEFQKWDLPGFKSGNPTMASEADVIAGSESLRDALSAGVPGEYEEKMGSFLRAHGRLPGGDVETALGPKLTGAKMVPELDVPVGKRTVVPEPRVYNRGGRANPSEMSGEFQTASEWEDVANRKLGTMSTTDWAENSPKFVDALVSDVLKTGYAAEGGRLVLFPHQGLELVRNNLEGLDRLMDALVPDRSVEKKREMFEMLIDVLGKEVHHGPDMKKVRRVRGKGADGKPIWRNEELTLHDGDVIKPREVAVIDIPAGEIYSVYPNDLVKGPKGWEINVDRPNTGFQYRAALKGELSPETLKEIEAHNQWWKQRGAEERKGFAMERDARRAESAVSGEATMGAPVLKLTPEADAAQRELMGSERWDKAMWNEYGIPREQLATAKEILARGETVLVQRAGKGKVVVSSETPIAGVGRPYTERPYREGSSVGQGPVRGRYEDLDELGEGDDLRIKLESPYEGPTRDWSKSKEQVGWLGNWKDYEVPDLNPEDWRTAVGPGEWPYAGTKDWLPGVEEIQSIPRKPGREDFAPSTTPGSIVKRLNPFETEQLEMFRKRKAELTTKQLTTVEAPKPQPVVRPPEPPKPSPESARLQKLLENLRSQYRAATTEAQKQAITEYGQKIKAKLGRLSDAITQPQVHGIVSSSTPKTRRYYHGTSKNFSEPDPSMFSAQGMTYGPGYYMTTNPNVAEGYALGSERVGANIRPIDVPENLLFVDVDKSASDILADIRDKMSWLQRRRFDSQVQEIAKQRRLSVAEMIEDANGEYAYALIDSIAGGGEKAVKLLSSLGYDGIRYSTNKDSIVVVFRTSLSKITNPLSGGHGLVESDKQELLNGYARFLGRAVGKWQGVQQREATYGQED